MNGMIISKHTAWGGFVCIKKTTWNPKRKTCLNWRHYRFNRSSVNIFIFGKKTLKKKRGTAIGTKFAPPYSILFMTELEEKIIKESEYKPYLWWRYTDDIFFIWEHGENKLKSFLDKINKVHPTIKFTDEWSKTFINFLDVTISCRRSNRNWPIC